MKYQIHTNLGQFSLLPNAEFDDLLLRRQQDLAERTCGLDETQSWLARSYPVLSVLAPVLTSHVGKIEYPGDPMCLYAALSWTIDQVVRSKQAGLSASSPYNDLCPRLGDLPSADYRRAASVSGIRVISGPLFNTDQTVFDPRVWNDEIKHYFVDLLKTIQPRVVLISATSPAHRYALDIAGMVREHDPSALIVMGGRHLDETIHYNDFAHEPELAYSSTVRAIKDGRAAPVVDFLISGEGYFALDLLMKAISIAMDIESKTTTVRAVVNTLDQMAAAIHPVPGRAVLAALDGGCLQVFPIRGRPTNLGDLPPFYRPFVIRAEFPIFKSSTGQVQRTAHINTAHACPFRCNYCSESVSVVGQLLKLLHHQVKIAIDHILEYVSYGAEAIFFDDSVFWAGSRSRMIEFCIALSKAKTQAAAGEELPWLQNETDRQRFLALQWGAQMTFDFITTLQSENEAIELLGYLKAAGCTYIYFGLESMSPSVIARVHKNLGGELPWNQRVRKALALFKQAEIRVGVSVLFGLDGETRETIEETIEQVAQLVQDDLIYIASPNICTYHPGTAITRMHDKENTLDYVSLDIKTDPPYIYFEEAFRGVVSRDLTEDDIWHIHRQTQERWGQKRNVNAMQPTLVPVSAMGSETR